jgi:hypothetical protein
MISKKFHPFNSIRPKIMFGIVLERSVNLPHVKRCKTCVAVLDVIFRGTEVVKMVSDQMPSFYSITQNMIVWSVFEQFKNIDIVKDSKCCIESKCTISEHRCCKNGFTQNACILLYWTKNEGLDCFRAFQKPS